MIWVFLKSLFVDFPRFLWSLTIYLLLPPKMYRKYVEYRRQKRLAKRELLQRQRQASGL